MEENKNRSPAPSPNSSPPPDTAPGDMAAAGAGSVAGGESEATDPKPVVKRGRGRPRKTERAVSPPPRAVSPPLRAVSPPPGFPAQPLATTAKPAMPHGSGKVKMVTSLGCLLEKPAESDFTFHKVTVNPGENAVSEILSFFDERAPEDVFILSAVGEVSSVLIRQSGAPVRYEGEFEILSLTGQCTYTRGAGGVQRENVTLTILLAKPNGHTFGGVIESSLIADTPIHIIMGAIKKMSIPKQSNKRNSSGSPKGDQDSAKAPPSASGSMPEATTA